MQIAKLFIFGDTVAFGQGGIQQQRVTRRLDKYYSGRVGGERVRITNRLDKVYNPDCLQLLFKDIDNAYYYYSFIYSSRKLRLIYQDYRTLGNITQATLVQYILPELIRFQQEYTIVSIDDSLLRLENDLEDEDVFELPLGLIPEIALSNTAFYTLIQGRIDVDSYNLAIIVLKNMPVLVLDRASTYKGKFQREIENRSILYTLDIWPPNSLDLNCIKNVQALMKVRLNRLLYAGTNKQLIA